MSWHVLYAVIGLLGFVSQIGLLIILVVRRHYKTFPIFTLYLAVNLLCDLGTVAVGLISPQAARALYLALPAATVPARARYSSRDSLECSPSRTDIAP